jgi:hypothetical protein
MSALWEAIMQLRKLFAPFFLTVLISPISYPQGVPPSESPQEFRIIDRPLNEALKQAAATFQTVIGLEEVTAPHQIRLVTVRLERATIAETMDALVKADPRYSWERGANGAIRVFTRASRPSIADVVINDFHADSLSRNEAVSLLDSTESITGWEKSHDCSRLDVVVTAGRLPEGKHNISLNIAGKTLRETLDEVARQSGTLYWIIDEFTMRDGCHVSIQLPPPNIPRRRGASAQPSK